MVGLKRYTEVADEEGLRITSQEATLVGVSSMVLIRNFEVMQTAEVNADRVCLVGYYRHQLVDRKDLAHLRGGDSDLGRGSDGCGYFSIIRLAYDRHKTVVAREERAGYRFGKIFINGVALRGAEGEGVVGIEDR